VPRVKHRAAMKTILHLLVLNFLLAATALAQSTTWRAADNPHVVNGTYTVPAGQTLILEPGVVVQIKAGSTLQVEGQLTGQGTATNRITITGAVNYSSKLIIAGSSNLAFTDIQTQTVPESNGVLLFADCRFSGNGSIFNGQVLQPSGTRASYVQLDRCAFIGDGTYWSASLYVSYCTVVVRNTSFSNASYMSVSPGYLFLDNVTSDNSTQFGLNIGSDSDLYVNNVRVSNATYAGLVLSGDTRNGTNVLLGPNVTLQGNEYPIHLTIAGLYPESNVPATGNRNNAIHASDVAGANGLWPKFAIPYYVDGSPLTIGGPLWISPGVTVKMAPYSYFNDVAFAEGMRAFGTKEQPIIFQRADPSQPWYDLHADRTYGGRLRHTIVEGSSDGVNGGDWRLENCIFRNNAIGTSGGAIVSGSQYLNNGTGHVTLGTHNSPENPNSFEGNGLGVNYSSDARNVWWGSPSGPTTPRNPGGTGDRIENQQTQFQPFLTARPDYSDAPPEVRLLRPAFEQVPGSKVTLRWESTDDVGIVSHKVLFSAVGNYTGSFVEIATLPGNQRTYEWTVPTIGFQNAGDDAYIKVVAIDTTGKSSFDEWEIIVPTNNIQGTVTFNVTAGQTFESGEILETPFTASIEPYMTQTQAHIEVVGVPTRRMYGRGMPFVSTDTARYVVAYGDTTNHQKYWYSPFFKIRPKSLLGDAPPTVSLTSPQAGQSYAPGAVIPIVWTASDDEGLRGFDIVSSSDRGRTWSPIVRNLPADVRSYNWQTAPGTGYTNVRVMVIARDWRFQTSSDGANRAFATNSGAIEPAVSSIAVNPSKIASEESAIGTVTIAQPAPPGGTLVTISHNGQVFLNVPANVTIPAGGTTATFPISTTNVTVSGTFQISATSGGVTLSTELTVTLRLTGLDLPETVQGGSVVNGSVTLSGPAPSGGAVVHLVSTDPNVAQVPSSVTVPEGKQAATFATTTKSVSAQQSITVTGNYDGTAKQISLVVSPAGAVSPTPTISPSPTPTIAPSPTPSATASPIPTTPPPISPSPTAAATATPTATATAVPSATVSPTPPAVLAAQPLNIATRGRVGSGDDAMIGGFIVTGNAPKKVIVRAIGPSLQGSLTGALTDTVLQLRAADGSLIRQNDNWQDDASQAGEVQANGVAPIHSLESAVVETLAPGNYTAIVNGKNGASGIGVVEIYDLSQAGASKLANISTRAIVGADSNVMIGGFILGNGSSSTRMLIRALGPSLAASGITNALSDPTLDLRNANGALLVANDNWKDQQQAAIAQTGIAPNDSSEAAILTDLAPGAYTAVVSGKGIAAGVALIEGL
jgi:hypothetical protein